MSTDILCAKGTATTSRWRGYDHKDAFQPAQRATAPPSDADVMGSWVKYDGSVPVVTPLDKAVRDEELPTSWYKYETKPFASLLEKRELRPKAPIYLAETPPPVSEQPAEPETPAEAPALPAEPVISEAVRTLDPEAEAKVEIPEAPIDEVIPEALEAVPLDASSAPEMPSASSAGQPDGPETQAAEPLTLSLDSVGAPAELEPSGDVPIELAPAPVPEPETATAIPAAPPVLVADTEPMPVPVHELPRSEEPVEPVPAGPASPTLSADPIGALEELELSTRAPIEAAPAPIAEVEPVPATPVEEPPAVATIAMPVPAEEPARSQGPIEPVLGEPPSSAVVHALNLEPAGEAVANVPEAALPIPQAETAPAAPVEEPPVLAAHAESMPVEDLPHREVSVEPEVFAPAVTEQEPAPGPDLSVETRAAPPAAETAAEAALVVEPSDERELARVAAAAIKTPNPAKKAMLSRLADLLERALSAKRSAGDGASPHVGPAPEVSAPSAGQAETSAEVVQSQAFQPPERAALPPDLQTEPGATEPAASEITADLVVSAEVAIEPVPLAAIAEASPVAPETPALEVSAEIEATASAPAEIAAPAPSLDLDEPSFAPGVPLEAVGIAEPLSAVSEEVVARETEPTPEPEAPFASLADAPPDIAPVLEAPAVAPEATTGAPAAATEQPEIGVSPQEPRVADLEPAPVFAREEPRPSDEAVPDAMSAVDPAPIAASGEAYPAERASESDTEIAAPIEAAPVSEAVAEAPAAAPVQIIAAAPIDEEKAAQEALASDLADMIHNVLSTTQFATKTLKPGRYIPAQSTGEPEPGEPDDGGEIAADELPHPVAIRSRLSRIERVVAVASLGMMILAGYFAISLWRQDSVSAQAPVIAASPASPAAALSKNWGERARDITRELGAAVMDPSKTPGSMPQTVLPDAAGAQRSKPSGAQVAQ